MTIPLYKAEIEAGLADKIKASACVAYHAEIKPGFSVQLDEAGVQAACAAIKQGKNIYSGASDLLKAAARIDNGAAEGDKSALDILADNFGAYLKSMARLSIPEGMYTVPSILVSTTRNLNDDIFLPEEVWAARHSPAHKPGNINHNEKKIIGHTIYTVPVTGDMAAENPQIQVMDAGLAVDELPELFHLFNLDVIYTDWEDADWKSEVMGVIGAIEMGKMCVSMECLFKGFDYGLTDASGKCRVVARNADTAWLSKHLRAYDGLGLVPETMGEFAGQKVGRILRTLSFIGKGYTDTPANPNSIIFHHKNSVTFLPKSVSSLQHVTNKPENTMPTEAEKLAAAEAKVASLTEEVTKVAALEGKLTQADTDAKAAAKKLEASEAKATELETSIVDLKAKLAAAETELAAMKDEKQKEDKKKFWEKRKAAILAAGLDEAAAEAAATKYEAVADELFEDVLVGLAAKFKAVKEAADAAEAAKAGQVPSKTKTTVDLTVAEETEAADASVTVIEDTDEAKQLLNALTAAVASTLKVKMEGK